MLYDILQSLRYQLVSIKHCKLYVGEENGHNQVKRIPHETPSIQRTVPHLCALGGGAAFNSLFTENSFSFCTESQRRLLKTWKEVTEKS